jgi:2-keto-4-pentenoate hydratase/2-oxohepta-3-ene-1,7-dioic acid hydratase in catechol pathway
VAGYAIFNDISVREFAKLSSQWTLVKNFDETGAFGPWLTLPNVVPLGAKDLMVHTFLNGVMVQEGNTSDMIFGTQELIQILSEVSTLEPGDVIITGTPKGVGAGRKPPLFMKPGDICEVEISKLGRITNPITG